MQRTLFALVLPFVLGIAGCAGSSAQTQGTTPAGSQGASAQGAGGNAAPDPSEETDCHDETMTGSSIPRHVCRTKAQQQLDREGGQEWVNRPRSTPTTSR
jgi:hypothetical protein